jgi:hypothetical protein
LCVFAPHWFGRKAIRNRDVRRGEMSEVSVEPEKLRPHATNVEKVGQSLSQALEAAQAVSLPTAGRKLPCSSDNSWRS